ncbi:MAG: RNA polymerase sigma factor [Flavobacteriales bacterium]|nr:RNA polymerase sigma factor [Flavobacteriales bacterium]
MALFRNPYLAFEDEKLMQLVGEKDQKAFGVLYDRYGKLLYNYFHKMLWKDKEKSRDFTQDLFAKLVHKPHLYDPSRPFKTWLYSIAHNMCKNEYAKAEVRRNAQPELAYVPNTEFRNEAQSSMDRAEFNIKLAEALDELDETKRTTFELRFRHEMSIEEIGETMQCSEGTVKSRLFYTLKQLNQKLKVFEGIA